MTDAASAPCARPIWLASASPRRRHMLEQAGITVLTQPSDFDDALLDPGDATPDEWVLLMAQLKARRVAEMLSHREEPPAGTVLAADTVCSLDGEIIGQPRDAGHARSILMRLRGRAHETITGVCLIDRASGCESRFLDRASVRMGEIDDEMIEAYVSSGAWRGKAGAYNLSERRDAGWPIEVEGDPATVMGLPMRRLLPLLVPEARA